MGARLVVALVLSAVLGGVLYWMAKPDEAEGKTEDAKKTISEVKKKAPANLKKAAEETKGWFSRDNNWVYVAGAGAALIFLVLLTVGRKKEPERDGKKRND